jgi:hypothetical protein
MGKFRQSADKEIGRVKERELELMKTENDFFEAIKQRSEEHQKAFDFAMKEKLYSQVGSIIRQELDSLIRLNYYRSLNFAKKQELLRNFFAGDKAFPSDKNLIAQFDPESLLYRLPFLGWAEHIYKVGCAFVHLTQMHNWEQGEPELTFTDEERKDIVMNVNWWQKEYMKTDFALKSDFSFTDLVAVAPGIFNKLRTNLLGEIKGGE